MIIRRICPALLWMSLAACANQPSVSSPAASQPASQAASAPSMPNRMGEAMITPLTDLNLTRTAIPDALKEALVAPYALPADLSCVNLMVQVRSLDAALGADLDTPPSANNPSLLERGMGEVGNASVSALRNTAEGILPFRGWIRKLTGAERHSRRVAAAITAGSIRRAYLKGLGQAHSCGAPAAPVTNLPMPSVPLAVPVPVPAAASASGPVAP